MRTSLLLSVLFGLGLTACSSDECLATQENCTQAYKQSQYGRTDIQCCSGSCTEGIGNGVLICH